MATIPNMQLPLEDNDVQGILEREYNTGLIIEMV